MHGVHIEVQFTLDSRKRKQKYYFIDICYISGERNAILQTTLNRKKWLALYINKKWAPEIKKWLLTHLSNVIFSYNGLTR